MLSSAKNATFTRSPPRLADLARKHIDFLERTGLPIPAPTTHESL